MKSILSFYRILSFILLPIAGILAFMGVFVLIVALAYPQLLLAVFLIAGVVIYTFTSFSFLSKGIIANRRCKASLRDWIRVNAFVAIAFVVEISNEGRQFLTDKNIQKQELEMLMAMTAKSPNSAGITPEHILQMLKGFTYGMFVWAVLLLLHIFFTFRLMRQYKEVFETQAP